MKPLECPFEPEVLAAAVQSRWPERVDAELRAHVAACAICADVAAIAGVMEEARQETRALASVPDSGRVWRLAQMRARREAAAAANRPIAAAQVIAFACAIGLLDVCFRATSAWFQSALQSIGAAVGGLDPRALLAASPLRPEHGALALAMATLLFLVPAAIYLAMGRD